MTDASPPRYYALVPCAGVGLRAAVGGPKQYARLAGRAMVSHTLEALGGVNRLDATLVVLAPDDDLFDAAVPSYAGPRTWVARCGGDTRARTVANGLVELAARGAGADDWVLVHDAARCLVRASWIEHLIDACTGDAVGGLLALPVSDTLKQSRGDRAVATIDRSHTWAAQTPQMFRLGLLQRALAAAGTAVTDDASAIESLGLQPRLVQGDRENLKLTWPDDFVFAERVLAERRAAAHQGRP
jgi:2-C-methyl-D-erythritol 4-phosphate cytidylyltransferase